MWFITFNDSESNSKYINNTFHNRIDAFKYIQKHLNNNHYSNVAVKNADTQLISTNIQEGSLLQIHTESSDVNYGIIEDISDYLVFIKKLDGSTAELTKSRINKEYISGKFKITPYIPNLKDVHLGA